MRILIVQCHPSAESFGASLAETVRKTLADSLVHFGGKAIAARKVRRSPCGG